jgi:large subunit ribosomal protein L23
MELSNVIKRPLITEKTMAATAQNKFTFKVDWQATKATVKQAVEVFFKVKVKKVWLTTIAGKTRRVGAARKNLVKKPDWKKATVKLLPGQKIDLFDVKGKTK